MGGAGGRILISRCEDIVHVVDGRPEIARRDKEGQVGVSGPNYQRSLPAKSFLGVKENFNTGKISESS